MIRTYHNGVRQVAVGLRLQSHRAEGAGDVALRSGRRQRGAPEVGHLGDDEKRPHTLTVEAERRRERERAKERARERKREGENDKHKISHANARHAPSVTVAGGGKPPAAVASLRPRVKCGSPG